MFKITKKKVHKRRFSSRSGLSLKRASYAHHNLLELVERFKKSPSKSTLLLRKFLEDDLQREFVKKWVIEGDYVAFDTAWEGALKIVRTLEREECSRAIRADQELLLKDLLELKDFLLTPSMC